MSFGLTSQAATHPGAVRPRNEDAYVDRPDLGLWAVADGAGGHGAGDVASSAIAEALMAIPPGFSAAEMLAQVRLRLDGVHTALQDKAAARGGGIIASTVVVLLARGGHYACLWAGDSRAYRLRAGAIARLTRDHTQVQALVEAGLLTPEQADHHPYSNVLARAIGAEARVEIDIRVEPLRAGDRYLLCSDGLDKELSDPQIAALLGGANPAQVARALVEHACTAGGRDNVTAVVVRFDAPAD